MQTVFCEQLVFRLRRKIFCKLRRFQQEVCFFYLRCIIILGYADRICQMPNQCIRCSVSRSHILCKENILHFLCEQTSFCLVTNFMQLRVCIRKTLKNHSRIVQHAFIHLDRPAIFQTIFCHDQRISSNAGCKHRTQLAEYISVGTAITLFAPRQCSHCLRQNSAVLGSWI